MQFTHDWFSHNIPNWQKWLAPLVGKHVNALEIGCYEGKATCWLFENVPDIHVTVVDTFEGSEEHQEFKVPFEGVAETFRSNISKWANRVEIFTGKSADVVRHFGGPFDFAYIDGSHTAPDVLTDGCMVWPIIRPGGIVIFDDYGWDHYREPERNPRLGVDSFLNAFVGKYTVIAKEYQVAIQKNAYAPVP